jgi:hypothetical protein
MAVGSSALHTPIKHRFLDIIVGQIVGAASTPRLNWIDTFLTIDCCAGNGDASIHSWTSSPEILYKHLDWASRHDLKATGIFIEKHSHTVEMLRRNMLLFPKYGELFPNPIPPDIIVIHGDYRSSEVAKQIGPVSKKTAVFLHIDPNNVHGVQLSKELRAVLPIYTTMLVTLGCNAGGVKRLPESERLQWFDRLEYLLQLMRPHHDACLVQLERDRAQWAYLLTVPKVWRSRIEDVIPKLGDEYWAKGLGYEWYSDGNFWKMAERLFLKVDGSERSPI